MPFLQKAYKRTMASNETTVARIGVGHHVVRTVNRVRRAPCTGLAAENVDRRSMEAQCDTGDIRKNPLAPGMQLARKMADKSNLMLHAVCARLRRAFVVHQRFVHYGKVIGPDIVEIDRRIVRNAVEIDTVDLVGRRGSGFVLHHAAHEL